MTTPVEGFAFLASTPCAADAVVRIAFKGGDVFPQGRRFRIIFPWGNGWYLSSLDRPKPRSATDVVCRLSRGDKVEVFLDGEGDVIGGEFGFGLYTIPVFTDHPQIDPERRPSWYRTIRTL